MLKQPVLRIDESVLKFVFLNCVFSIAVVVAVLKSTATASTRTLQNTAAVHTLKYSYKSTTTAIPFLLNLLTSYEYSPLGKTFTASDQIPYRSL